MQLELPTDFFETTYALTTSQMSVAMEHRLLRAVGDNVVVGVSQLDHDEYERLGLCRKVLQHSPRPISTKAWGGEDDDELYDCHEQCLWKIEWNDAILFLMEAVWSSSCGGESRRWLIARKQEIAEAFILDVARKTNHPGKALMVFRGGCWKRSRSLYQAVQRASFDDLVLPSELISSLRSDFRQFLNSREHYMRYGLPWRRGAMFVGPPGNGKTHCVRALVKELEIPCLYVQSLAHPHLPSQYLLRAVFERARNLRPCVLIFEDLDALIDCSNQSFFLNQLDGLERNEGLIVLATTNHPGRIDPAITHRPSRFDRKYHFDLPDESMRLRFLSQWQAAFADRVRWSDESKMSTAAQTSGYSFAYLKELMVSSLMSNLEDEQFEFDEHVRRARTLLTSQMKTESQLPSVD